jgi:CHAD domain-containing protein
MPSQLKATETVSHGLKRIVRREIDKALKALSAREGVNPVEGVHDARRAFKKIRAILKLARKELGNRVYERENVGYRDAGRPLTEVRDAQVLVETLDKLADRFAAEVPPAAFQQVRDALVANNEATWKRVLDEEDAGSQVADTLKVARRHIRDWTIAHDSWKALDNGLKSAYGRARKAFATASAEPTVENSHEWRKRVKDLWHQLQILQVMEPGVLEQEANQAHELADVLGDEHDLAVLSQFLTEVPAKFGEPASVAKLLALIVRRRAELQQAANLLGRKVHAERPKEFVARLHDYWHAWRTGQAKKAG